MIIYTDNLIPVMTSATAPSGKASDSGATSNYYFWYALDSNKTNRHCSVSSIDSWFKYEFENALAICKYTLTPSGNNINSSGYTWKFQGSNNDLDWVDLHVLTVAQMFTANVKLEFEFNNSTSYKYYRHYKTSTGYIDIVSFEMMALASITTEIIVTNPAGTVLKNTDYNFEFSITPPVFREASKNYTMNDAGLVGDGKMFSYAPDMTKWEKVYRIEII